MEWIIIDELYKEHEDHHGNSLTGFGRSVKSCHSVAPNKSATAGTRVLWAFQVEANRAAG